MPVDSDEFDRPLYKVLAPNDTGQALGHQSGFVIPKTLDGYFPQLPQQVTPAAPAPAVNVTASLFDGASYLGDVQTRYQLQTWGGTRRERRMTSNLSKLLNLAQGDDILLIERGLVDQNHYRLTLIRHGNPQYGSLFASLNGKRWGPLDAASPPVTEVAILKALNDQQQHESLPFSAFDNQAPLIESRNRKIARSRAFQRRLKELYAGRCAICSQALTRLDGKTEAEAAHIVPRSLKGADDARNGVLLCRAHHWAFDNGLIGIADNLSITVPPRTLTISANVGLGVLAGKPIVTPSIPSMLPHLDSIRWHRKHFSIQ